MSTRFVVSVLLAFSMAETVHAQSAEGSATDGETTVGGVTLRHVRIEGIALSVYVVPPELVGRRSVDPSQLTPICTRTPCDLWLPNEIDLAVRRHSATRARTGLQLPTGPGLAQVSASPTGKRVAGGVFFAGAAGIAANLIGYGVAFEYDPLVFGGLLMVAVAILGGLTMMIRAGRPRARWLPGPPPTPPGRGPSSIVPLGATRDRG